MTTNEATILKQDVLGRVQTPAARRDQILVEFERSGLPGLKFAELIGVNYQTFATWAQKRRRKRGDYAKMTKKKKKKPVRWLEAVAAPATEPVKAGAVLLVLQLPGGARLEISDVRQVALAAALMRALQKPC